MKQNRYQESDITTLAGLALRKAEEDENLISITQNSSLTQKRNITK
jgi:hypothetical protein